jgi:hypothetical protein
MESEVNTIPQLDPTLSQMKPVHTSHPILLRPTLILPFHGDLKTDQFHSNLNIMGSTHHCHYDL